MQWKHNSDMKNKVVPLPPPFHKNENKIPASSASGESCMTWTKIICGMHIYLSTFKLSVLSLSHTSNIHRIHQIRLQQWLGADSCRTFKWTPLQPLPFLCLVLFCIKSSLKKNHYNTNYSSPTCLGEKTSMRILGWGFRGESVGLLSFLKCIKIS